MESHEPTETTEGFSTTTPSSSPFKSFKSKKTLRSNSNSVPSDEIQPSDPHTPMKPMQLRSRTRGVALSLNQVKKVAEGLNKSNKKDPSDLLDLIESSSRSTKQASAKKKAEKSIKLPERYELLAKFFDNMQSTIRLLKLKGKMRSFTNICPGVECLSDRRFTYTHLSQMKYVLPEAIELKKIMLVDEQTRCSKSDLEVSLLADAIESDGKERAGSGYTNLSKVFRTRLLEFGKTHSEEAEIPMGELPEPFNKRIQNDALSLKQNCVSSLPVPSSSDVLPQQSSVAASHMSRSFKTRFTQKTPISEAEKTQLISITLNSSGQSEEVGPNVKSSSSGMPYTSSLFPKLHTINYTSSSLGVVPVSATLPRPVEICEAKVMKNGDSSLKEILHSEGTPAKHCPTPKTVSSTPKKPVEADGEGVKVAKNKDCCLKETPHCERTPAKLASTPARLMTSTPALQTPKRCHIIQDTASTPSPNKLVRRPPKRPLFNTPVKKAKSEDNINETGRSSSDAYLINLLPEALRHSIMKKESKTNKEHEIAISHAKRRRQMIACLPKLFNMIHLMFQSVNTRVITKEELMHKIIAGQPDITDRAELEEQLKLMKELVPDWIQEKVASSGDLLLSINKLSCPVSVRRRLTEAL